MEIKIRGAREHNLKDVDVNIGEGLTVVSGVSGSGKTSLIFDTLYQEARRRFLEAFSTRITNLGTNPAKVSSIIGLGPTIALGQNLLNRNPNSTLASASGLSPFLRLLFARFGLRSCNKCGATISILKQDEIIAVLEEISKSESAWVSAILIRKMIGSHKTLLELLSREFDPESVIVDNKPLKNLLLDPKIPHDISIRISKIDKNTQRAELNEIIQTASALGSMSLLLERNEGNKIFSITPICIECGTWFGNIEPTYFNRKCTHCEGKGCEQCNNTGLYPAISKVSWSGLSFVEFLKKSVGDLLLLFDKEKLPASIRLIHEIKKRLKALHAVGLDYLTLDRSSTTLSRGESQRVRLAVALSSELEDITHILDEPTVGQHPADIACLLPVFRNLKGPVIYIEHDKQAVAFSDNCIDMGPGAGNEGGRIIFTGTPSELWKANTPSGAFFSARELVKIPKKRPEAQEFFIIEGAYEHNLKNIIVKVPINRLTVITGVSGSGKSTLVEDVIFPTLKNKIATGCKKVTGPLLKPILVDQGPIGHNPRSNPATYTKISDIIRNLFAKATNLTPSHFSFNTQVGACSECSGMGAIEVKMSYLPSTWVPCSQCEGERFSDYILSKKVQFGDKNLSIADFYNLPIKEITELFIKEKRLSAKDIRSIRQMLIALNDIGLGYLTLGQPSPTLSGGEAQRVKLAKFLGKKTLKDHLIILDEPSTGLHPKDLAGLILILNRLINTGATVLIVEHNMDIIKAADWVLDLGPGSGPNGGQILYQGPYEGLLEKKESITAQALKNEGLITPGSEKEHISENIAREITIKNAHIHNLKNIDISFPKKKFTVVTGVSGSGKSSLVIDTLELEARRRYLETLSMYERQRYHEQSEALMDEIIGLGITSSIMAEKKMHMRFFNIRNSIGVMTNITNYLAVLFSYIGEKWCPKCSNKMERKATWMCSKCKMEEAIAKPKNFISYNYSAACKACNGVGSVQVPKPEKLIIHPEKPLCNGAMYSPGFFPKGYLCKPYNGGYYIIQALAQRYDFDSFQTPWNEMTKVAQEAFLYGDSEPLEVTFENKKGIKTTRKMTFLGFYGQWLREWDIGGTYSQKESCKECMGSKLRPEFLSVKIEGYNIHELNEMPLSSLARILNNIKKEIIELEFVKNDLEIILNRLKFLIKTGLGYVNLNRIGDTLSAGEAQRIRLAGLLGSDLTSLTILLDEPSRGLHPSELQALIDILLKLRDKGNTVIAIEHDPLFIRFADYIVDMGPGAGNKGGNIVAKGTINDIKNTSTITADWINGKRKIKIVRNRRQPKKWMTIYGARENNLKGEQVDIPLGVFVGVCGVSGSGKSTLLIDTIGRALAPKKHTTSVAQEPIEPGKYDRIEGFLPQTIIIDQAKEKMGSPIKYLELDRLLYKVYAETEDAKILGLTEDDFGKKCSECKGKGYIKIDMQFLPDIVEFCETCNGSGYQSEVWDVKFKDFSLPDLNTITIDEALELFKEYDNITGKLKVANNIGLGYLQLNQPARALSGGEIQRLKIVQELSKKAKKETLYVLDEPTIGQHLEDISKLIEALQILVDNGHSVIVIEHSPHLLAACDWIIELGLGAGPDGGRVIAKGTPELIASGNTPIASYLKEILEGKK